MKISIVIPVYKNKELLQKAFDNNYRFIKDCEIIVVNDSPEESIADVFEKYSTVKLLANDINIGFAKTVNRGVAESTGELVFLLNSDVILKDDSFKNTIKLFNENEKLFAVSFAQIEQDKSVVGKNKVFFERGLLMHTKADNLDKGPTGWAEGGTCIVRKSYFDELNGFSTRYFPFYWEDVDLSLRAKKRGWEVIFDPTILVEHHHASTIGKYYKNNFREIISYRNQFICTWKNATPTQLLFHIVYLPILLIQSIVSGNWNLLQGFVRALPNVL